MVPAIAPIIIFVLTTPGNTRKGKNIQGFRRKIYKNSKYTVFQKPAWTTYTRLINCNQ